MNNAPVLPTCILITLLASLILPSNVLSKSESKDLTSYFNEQWLKSVIAIEQRDSEGSQRFAGTGFVIVHPDNQRLLLITAAHVVRNKSGDLKQGLAYVRADTNLPQGTVTDESLSTAGLGAWFFSSDNDVALRAFGTPTTAPPISPIPLSVFLSDPAQLQVGATLLILGFPMGLRLQGYEAVIARSAMVSSKGPKYVLLEAFVFPGNSGGPVVYAPSIKMGDTFTNKLLNEERLVGIVKNYIPYEDVAISKQTRETRVIFQENSGLSDMVPASAILDLLEREDVQQYLKQQVPAVNNSQPTTQ